MERKPFICLRRPRASLLYIFIIHIHHTHTFSVSVHYRVAHTPRWCGFSFVFFIFASSARMKMRPSSSNEREMRVCSALATPCLQPQLAPRQCVRAPTIYLLLIFILHSRQTALLCDQAVRIHMQRGLCANFRLLCAPNASQGVKMMIVHAIPANGHSFICILGECARGNHRAEKMLQLLLRLLFFCNYFYVRG